MSKSVRLRQRLPGDGAFSPADFRIPPAATDAELALAHDPDYIAARDRMVLDAFGDAGVPVALAMAGGYARDIEDTVDVRCATLALAQARWHERATASQ